MEHLMFDLVTPEPKRRFLVKATAKSIWGLLKYLRSKGSAELASTLSWVDVPVIFYPFRPDEYPEDSLERDDYWEAIAHTLRFTRQEAEELISWLAGRHEFLTGLTKESVEPPRFPGGEHGCKLWNVDFDPQYDLSFNAVGIVHLREGSYGWPVREPWLAVSHNPNQSR